MISLLADSVKLHVNSVSPRGLKNGYQPEQIHFIMGSPGNRPPKKEVITKNYINSGFKADHHIGW
jgi:hypothetical protein